MTPSAPGTTAYFDIQQPSPAKPLGGQFTLYLRPTLGATSVEFKYESEFNPNGPRCVTAIKRDATSMICKPESSWKPTPLK